MKSTSDVAEGLLQLNEAYSFVDDSDDSWAWLDGLNPSQAFLACIGAGPWKEHRRKKVQSHALRALGNVDLAFCDPVSLGYPLSWQQAKVSALVGYLRENHSGCLRPMEAFCQTLRACPDTALRVLYKSTDTVGRAKVLDLYARDYLKVPSFPIDRHVKRVLQEADLPVKEDILISACYHAGLDPRYLARRLVGHAVRNQDLSEFKESV